jgi:hypothetical protein
MVDCPADVVAGPGVAGPGVAGPVGVVMPSAGAAPLAPFNGAAEPPAVGASLAGVPAAPFAGASVAEVRSGTLPDPAPWRRASPSAGVPGAPSALVG